jgi:histidine ammonia-lyase
MAAACHLGDRSASVVELRRMTALRIGDEPLTPAAVVAAARGGPIDVELTSAARERIARGRAVAEAVAKRRSVYGRTTGVGANRSVAVPAADLWAHSVRLLRSHAGGVGDPLPDELVRAMLLIRLTQMSAGGGGHRPELADALAAVLRGGRLPVLRDLGGIGTGDLTLLAQLGLALAGEGQWAEPAQADGAVAAPIMEIKAGDALPLMSSNAATHAAASLAWADACELLDAGLGIAALTFRALDGNREAFAPQVAAMRPLPGLTAVSERLWTLTEGAPAPARV